MVRVTVWDRRNYGADAYRSPVEGARESTWNFL